MASARYWMVAIAVLLACVAISQASTSRTTDIHSRLNLASSLPSRHAKSEMNIRDRFRASRPTAGSSRRASDVFLKLETRINDTQFEALLCPLLIGTNLDVDLERTTGLDTGAMTLPDCFFSASVLSLYTELPLVVRGSSATGGQSDPLLRLPSTMTLVWFNAAELYFVNPVTKNGANNGTYTPSSWSQFFTSHSLLTSFQVSSSNIGGPMPSVPLPAAMTTFSITNSLLSGTIPSNLLSQLTSSEIVIDFSGNKLSGTIPSNLISSLPSGIERPSMSIAFSANALTGTIPSGLFPNTSAMQSIEYLLLDLSNNTLSGSVSASIFGFNGPSSELKSLSFYVASNRLTSVTENLLSGFTSLKSAYLVFSMNRITGTLPLFVNHVTSYDNLQILIVYIDTNQLTGTLPSTLLMENVSAFPNFERITLNCSDNALTGTIPSAIISFPTTVASVSITLDASRNALTGSIPSNLFASPPSEITLLLAGNKLSSLPMPSSIGSDSYKVYVDLSFNPLGGTIPDGLLGAYSSLATYQFTWIMNGCGFTGPLPQSGLGYRSQLSKYSVSLAKNAFSASYAWDTLFGFLVANNTRYATISFDLSSNQFGGELNFPGLGYKSGSFLSLDLSYNRFSSLFINESANFFSGLTLSGNTEMTGSIPSDLFDPLNSYFIVRKFSANHTKLSGNLGNLTNAQNLYFLDLSNTNIDFCQPSNRDAWIPISYLFCDLKHTNATLCPSKYPSACFTEDPIKSVSPTSSAAQLSANMIYAIAIALILAYCM